MAASSSVEPVPAAESSENTPPTSQAGPKAAAAGVEKGGKKGERKAGKDMDANESKERAQIKALEKEVKSLNKEVGAAQRNMDHASREKEKLALELLRVNKQREKLEELCRELQKQNKTIQEDSKLRATEDQQRREELSAKFQDAVAEINTRLATQSEEQGKHLSENEALRNKLIEFSTKVDQREELFNNQLHAKTLENQLLEKRLEQEANRTAEVTLKMEAYAEQATLLMQTDKELRSQLSSYKEKFEQFQEMLTTSHDAFTTFKVDMDKMTKEIKKLKKENDMLRGKTMKSDTAIIEAVEAKANLAKKVETLELKNTRLETLCRTLQAQLKAKDAPATAAADTGASDE